jgi:hypothetical protein
MHLLHYGHQISMIYQSVGVTSTSHTPRYRAEILRTNAEQITSVDASGGHCVEPSALRLALRYATGLLGVVARGVTWTANR